MDTPFVKRAYNLGLKTVPNFANLSAEQIEYYEKHLDEIPAALRRGFVLPEPKDEGIVILSSPGMGPVVIPKFALFADLGIITVPDDYVHGTCLASFKEKNGKKFYDCHDGITDANFPNPSRVLKPGDKIGVRAWKQIIGGSTTSVERVAFLKSQQSVFVGAQGAALVFEQKHDQLPKGYWYGSFDEKDRLWEDAGVYRRVPAVHASSDGDFSFDLGYFAGPWSDLYAILSFHEVEGRPEFD